MNNHYDFRSPWHRGLSNLYGYLKVGIVVTLILLALGTVCYGCYSLFHWFIGDVAKTIKNS